MGVQNSQIGRVLSYALEFTLPRDWSFWKVLIISYLLFIYNSNIHPYLLNETHVI
jgi:hypothetical protein